MKQEDINAMMRHPGESVAKRVQLPKCPSCGYEYCGDGVELCLECEGGDGEQEKEQ